MIKRIICAIKGHRWNGCGWLGGLIQGGDMVLCYQCWRCRTHIIVRQPAWHHRAIYHQRIKNDPLVFVKPPDKYTSDEPDYTDQLDYINNKYPINVLAEVHDTTKKELRKLGYE